jgi:hypothetical protein
MIKLAESRALVDEMGAAGRRFAEGFSWDRSANETISHLEEVVTAKGEQNRWK